MEINFHTHIYIYLVTKKYNFFMPGLTKKASLGSKIIISMKLWIHIFENIFKFLKIGKKEAETKWTDKH